MSASSASGVASQTHQNLSVGPQRIVVLPSADIRVLHAEAENLVVGLGGPRAPHELLRALGLPGVLERTAPIRWTALPSCPTRWTLGFTGAARGPSFVVTRTS